MTNARAISHLEDDVSFRAAARWTDSILNCLQCQRGVVVLRAHMREEYVLDEPNILQSAHELRGILIGEMTCFACDAFLDDFWVGALLKHFRVIIAIDRNKLAGLKFV